MNLEDVAKNIFMGEISPCETYQLLKEEWHVGDNLAMALISHHGGHIWHLNLIVKELYEFGPTFFGNLSVVAYLAYSNVASCLAWDGGDGDDKLDLMKNKMQSVLQELAEKGFVPTSGQPYHNPVEEVITSFNVGGVVGRGSLIVGLLPEGMETY